MQQLQTCYKQLTQLSCIETKATPTFPVTIEELQNQDMLEALYDPWKKSAFA